MKLKEFQQYLRESNLDLVLLIHPDIHITYFTQTKPSFSFLSISPNSAKLHLTSLDKQPHITNISITSIKKNWDQKLAQKNIKRLGINKESLTVQYLEKIKKIFPKAKLIDISPKLKQLRSQKTREEIKKINHACKITDSVFAELINKLDRPNKLNKPNKLNTEKEISLFIDNKIKEQDGELAFPTIVATNKNSAIPHHITSNQRLRTGFLLFDFGACYQNYCSDMSRTIYLGKPSKKEKETYDLLLTAQSNSINNIQENLSFEELNKSTKKDLSPYSSHFIHSLGHGLGLEIH